MIKPKRIETKKCIVCSKSFKRRTRKCYRYSNGLRRVGAVTCSKECSRRNIYLRYEKVPCKKCGTHYKYIGSKECLWCKKNSSKRGLAWSHAMKNWRRGHTLPPPQ